jgi:hypothetical protein
VKTTLIWILLGALLGIAAASLIVPPALSWYAAPGGLPQGAQVQAVVEIPKVIKYSTGKLIHGQIVGGAIGAVLGLVVGLFAAVSARKRRASAASPPASAPPPAAGGKAR